MTFLLIIAYLLAAVASNLLIYWFGIQWAPAVAFIMVGFDLVSRDLLHDRWHGRRLALKMTCLIGMGSLLTIAVNSDATGVAIASVLSYILMGTSDAYVYGLLRHRSRGVRINGSNMISALIDSVSFIWIVTGSPLMPPILIQYAAKLSGGLLWSILLRKMQL